MEEASGHPQNQVKGRESELPEVTVQRRSETRSCRDVETPNCPITGNARTIELKHTLPDGLTIVHKTIGER